MNQPKTTTFAHISDTHLHADPKFTGKRAWSSRPITEAVMDSINAYPIPLDFVLHTGDVGNDPLRAEHYRVLRDSVFSKLTPPLYVMPGNHDHRIWLRQAFYPQHATPYYRFEVNGVQVICLDSSLPYMHHGGIEEEQLAWLDVLCSVDTTQPLVVALHHHPFALEADAIDSIRLTNGGALHRTLMKARHRLRCVLFGHIHERVMRVRDGILYASTSSTWYQSATWHGQKNFGQPNLHQPGYTVVTLSADGGVTMRFVEVTI